MGVYAANKWGQTGVEAKIDGQKCGVFRYEPFLTFPRSINPVTRRIVWR
tara:strand:- start:319 stop:465 length:147 start_codon:yes stop_codon:yes gene_type:complete